MDTTGNSYPDWLSDKAPYQSGCQGIRENLPVSMDTLALRKNWKNIINGTVPSPPTWELIESDTQLNHSLRNTGVKEALEASFPPATVLAWQVVGESWIFSHRGAINKQGGIEAFLEQHAQDLHPAVPLPEDIRVRFMADEDILIYLRGMDPRTGRKAPNWIRTLEWPCLFLLTRYGEDRPGVMFEYEVTHQPPFGRFMGSHRVPPDPSELGDLRYWVAVMQTPEGSVLVMFMSQPYSDLRLSTTMDVWQYGALVQCTLPVPVVEIDRTWAKLPKMVTYCRLNGLLFQAHSSSTPRSKDSPGEAGLLERL